VRFYQRRIRRIFLALTVMTLSVFGHGRYILPLLEFESGGPARMRRSWDNYLIVPMDGDLFAGG
jgi:hypothetical protein